MSSKDSYEYGKVKGSYSQRSVRERIKAIFLDNIGKIVTRDMIVKVAGDGIENWHQRLSELRTDEGYTILSWRDNRNLKPGEYLMPSSNKNPRKKSRILISSETWEKVLERAGNKCEWEMDELKCGLGEGDIDPTSGGTVHLTPDHKTPHSFEPEIDPDNPEKWQALCGKHQVMKKNFWDSLTGKLNVIAIVQSTSIQEKREVYEFLKKFFNENL